MVLVDCIYPQVTCFVYLFLGAMKLSGISWVVWFLLGSTEAHGIGTLAI
jgi:hypothetical protein